MISTTVKAIVIAAGIILVIAGVCLAVFVAPHGFTQNLGGLFGAIAIIFGALLTAGGAVTPRRRP